MQQDVRRGGQHASIPLGLEIPCRKAAINHRRLRVYFVEKLLNGVCVFNVLVK